MLLALKGKLVRTQGVVTPYSDLVEALTGMGYERHAAQEALVKAEAELLPGLDEAEREKLLFKQAIVQLTGNR